MLPAPMRVSHFSGRFAPQVRLQSTTLRCWLFMNLVMQPGEAVCRREKPDLRPGRSPTQPRRC